MPHKEYMRRLNNETAHPTEISDDTMRSLMNKKAGQASVPPPRHNTSDEDNCERRANRKNKPSANDKLASKPAGSIAARALAALEDSSDSSNSGFSSDGHGSRNGEPSLKQSTLSREPRDTSREHNLDRMLTPQQGSMQQTNNNQGQQTPLNGGMALKQKMQNAMGKGLGRALQGLQGLMGSPSGSINSTASQYSSLSPYASRRNSNISNITMGNQSNVAAMPQNNSHVAPIKVESLVNGLSSQAVEDKNIDGLVDLTGDSSGEEKKVPQHQTIDNNQMTNIAASNTGGQLKPTHTDNEQQRAGHSNGQLQTSNLPTEPPNEASAKRKSASARKSPPTTNRTAVTLTCSLTGTLSCAIRDGKKCHIIKGYWEYENTPGSSPQRFELLRYFSPDVETNPSLTTGGTFNGSFAYLWAKSKSEVEQHLSDKESIDISFTEDQVNFGKLFVISGSGYNKYGKFNISGTAEKRSMTESDDMYNLKFHKAFVELYPLSQVSPPPVRISAASSNKRNLSMMTKTISDVTEATRPDFNVHGNIHSEPMLLSQSEHYPRDNRKRGKWIEFGDLGGNNSSPSWNNSIRNVRPTYNNMTLDYFNSIGIVNVQDLIEADEEYLCTCLMQFNGFMAACAAEAWMRKVKRQTESSFRDVYRDERANRSIFMWKEEARMYKRATEERQLHEESDDSEQEEQIDTKMMDQAPAQNTEMERAPFNGQNPLESIVGRKYASILEKCDIKTAQQLLLLANDEELLNKLTTFFRSDFSHRGERDARLLIEGMVYSWRTQVREAVQTDDSTANTSITNTLIESGDESEDSSVLLTPLGYADLQFIRSQKIKSDEELANANTLRLAPKYVNYVGKRYKYDISLAEAVEVIDKWRQRAGLCLGLNSSEVDICETFPKIRLDKDSCKDMMHLIPNLCKTIPDDNNGGLPKRIIFAYDYANYVLYEFVVHVGKSLCSPDAGYGAFLSFKGARSLKASSQWKKKKQYIIHAQTRKPLEAIFSISGATVTLRGASIHNDEERYGPETDDSVGFFREFILDDFEEVKDNITFSSKHISCAMIELESRYAPLLPADRKTDLIFSVKDFLFSHEPSSWRFDVAEKINGYPQVVDFTDDITGAPHSVAKSHMSMYVNEVGHNMELVENVQGNQSTSRSVTYYINIEKPMAKGQAVELLVNYKEQYEEMRERRGYGNANLYHGVKGDDDDISRVLRNVKDRFLMKTSISTFSEDEVYDVVKFLQGKVWDGVTDSMSAVSIGSKEDELTLFRQCVARRRLDWIIRILRSRLFELMGEGGLGGLFSDNEDSMFQEGMFVYVNDWPKNDIRPPYSGLGNILSIKRDKFNREVFEVSTFDDKYIESVPMAVVSLPTEDDFTGISDRIRSRWRKLQKQQELPRRRINLLKEIDTMLWDPSFIWNVSNNTDLHGKILQNLRWEVAEETLFLLVQNKRLLDPFEEALWCPLAVSLMTKCFHAFADFILFGLEKTSLYQRLLGLARDAATELNDATHDLSLIDKLALQEKGDASKAINVVVVEPIHVNRMSVEAYAKDPMPLDKEWYLIHQIVLIIHPIASLIDWVHNVDAHYSIEKLCEALGLDTSAPYLSDYISKIEDWEQLS